MLTKQEAINIIRENLAQNLDILEDEIIDKPYGWLIFTQTKEFIRTQNWRYKRIGSGGTLVAKETGRCIYFGSAYSTETNLKIYELGYLQYDQWDIEIIQVENIQKTISLLQNLKICYVIPEEAYGKSWRVPQYYTSEQIKKKLIQLPVKFTIGNCYFKWEVLEKIKQDKAFDYILSEHTSHENN